MMKKCSKCGEEKPAISKYFYRHTRGKNGLRTDCKKCAIKYRDKYRKKNIQKINKQRRKKAKNRKQRLVDFFGGKCRCCGYDTCLAALEFHHKNPENKEFGLYGSQLLSKWRILLKEAKKCDLLCANCHRELHYAEKDDGYHD